jgi:hemolysin activation/secretion protein
MNFAMARRAGAIALGCCMVSPALAQEQGASVEAAPAAAVPADEPRVDILNYRIEGNTVLPRVAVEKAVMPFLGPKRPRSDVEAARAALEKTYRDLGYETVAVEIPEQEVRGGVIRLNVTELRVGRLRATGALHFSPDAIKRRVPALAEGTVPNYRQVSEQIARLNKSSDRLVSPTLRAGDTPGTVDVDLQVDDHSPLHGSFELNDRNSSRTERLRASASVRYANLFQLGHSLSLQGQMTPTKPGESWAVSGSYVAPIGSSGFTVLGYGVHSNSDVSAIGGIGVLGSGDIVGLRGLYGFTSGPATSPTVYQLIMGVDYKSFHESLILGADTAATPISYFPVTAQYSIAKHREQDDLSLSLTLTAGIRGLDASDLEFRLKRFNASASWATLRTDVSYMYKLPGDWRARANIAAQIASGPLISNEQFAAGGVDSVRGYYESQELGDDGASAQLQFETPSLAGKRLGINDLRLFAFADGAMLRVRDPLSSQVPTSRLLSVGGGISLRAFDYLNLSTLLAAPLREKSSVPMDIGNSLRGQFRLWAEF